MNNDTEEEEDTNKRDNDNPTVRGVKVRRHEGQCRLRHRQTDRAEGSESVGLVG